MASVLLLRPDDPTIECSRPNASQKPAQLPTVSSPGCSAAEGGLVTWPGASFWQLHCLSNRLHVLANDSQNIDSGYRATLSRKQEEVVLEKARFTAVITAVRERPCALAISMAALSPGIRGMGGFLLRKSTNNEIGSNNTTVVWLHHAIMFSSSMTDPSPRQRRRVSPISHALSSTIAV